MEVSVSTAPVSLENCWFLSLRWQAEVLFSVSMARLVTRRGPNSGSRACTMNGHYLDPGTSFPWCSCAPAALKSERPELLCSTVASCAAAPGAAAGQASACPSFSSNNIPFDPLCPQAFHQPYILTASKSAKQHQPGRWWLYLEKYLCALCV